MDFLALWLQLEGDVNRSKDKKCSLTGLCRRQWLFYSNMSDRVAEPIPAISCIKENQTLENVS